jgi:anion-transporting  ArsA/GET3 family ATPase
LTIASRPFFIVADRILGAAFLSDIAEFFTLFRTMEGPFVSRARRVNALLSSPSTAYVVVTSAESVAMQEARYLVDELRRRNHLLAAVVANRLLPAALAAGADVRASVLEQHPDAAVRPLAYAEQEIANVAVRQAAALSRMNQWGVPIVRGESRRGDITDVQSLLALGQAFSVQGTHD